MNMATQWRTGMGGHVGLDYGVLFHLLDLYDIKDQDERRDIFAGIQVMETTILRNFSKRPK